MAAHSSILAWSIPWTEEPGGLLFIGLQRQTWLKWLSMHACIVYLNGWKYTEDFTTYFPLFPMNSCPRLANGIGQSYFATQDKAELVSTFYSELDALVTIMFSQSAVFIYQFLLFLSLWSWLLGTSVFCLEMTLYPRAHRMTSLLLALAKLTFYLQHDLTRLK